MDKATAIQFMRQGIKITHRCFGNTEWMTMPDVNTVSTEEGYNHLGMKFWSYRQGTTWDDGYSFFNPSIDFNTFLFLGIVAVEVESEKVVIFQNTDRIGSILGFRVPPANPEDFSEDGEDTSFIMMVEDWLIENGH